MVQRKAPPQPVANMRSHEKKLDRQTSCSHSQQQQDSRTKGGGGDLKKKKMKMMKLERSIRAADLENLSPPPPPPSPLNTKRISSSPIKRSPNYMKPTSCSDARKEKLLLQVTTVHHPHDYKMRSPKKSSPSPVAAAVVVKPLKALSRQSSLKGVVRPVIKNLRGVVVNRATCSSTLKDSKFPKALDLSPGGTEAEGTSLFKVCPYSYCSLNGHRHHEPLPPLRCFVSARRKLLKTQKSMKLRALPSIRRVKVSEKDKERVDTEKEEAASAVEISAQAPDDDFFIEIYTGKPEICVVNGMLNSQKEYEAKEVNQASDVEDGKCSGEGKEDQMRGACADATVDDDDNDELGQKSEISNEEMDIFSVCSLEHVECDKHAEDAKEVEDYTSSQACNVMAESDDKESTFDFDYEEELKSPFSDNMMESSDITDDEFDSMSLLNEEHSLEQTVYLTGQRVAEINEDQLDEAAQEGDCIPPTDQEYQETAAENTDGGELGGTDSRSHDEVEVSCVAADQDIVTEEDGIQSRQDTEEYFEESCCSDEQSDESCPEESHEESGNEQQQEQVNSEEGKSKARTRIRRSKADEEVDKTRDFNPRGPRFLDEEPEPEGEKVDLRHQELDERKNSEEWMVDHALQQAVTKLATSRRRKVALLVEAFETVMPLPPYEKALRASTSGFIQPRFIQACS